MSITRRTFAKGALGTLAATALAGGVAASDVFAPKAAFADDAASRGEWKPSWCTNCHLPMCATQVLVKDGIVREIKGDPDGCNAGRLCPRGLSNIGTLYSPYRVQSPVKRTNPEKGLDVDPQWVEITWDEALDIVAQQLLDACAYNPSSIAACEGFGSEENFMNSPFFIALGTENVLPTTGSLCPEHFNQLHDNGQILDRVDLEHCEYVLEVGRTMSNNFAATADEQCAIYADAYRRGTKFVVVNPMSPHSAQRGEWVPILSGTDTAFALALIHEMIHELGQYDAWWLRMRTNAPYLVADEAVFFKPDRETHRGTYCKNAAGKTLCWDEKAGCAVPFDAPNYDDFALLGTYEVDGVTYKTCFQALADYTADKTPEWQEPLTTVPADKVREIARDLVEHAHFGATIDVNGYTFPKRGSVVYCGRGMACHMLGTEAGKAFGIINAMLGAVDVPGGMQGNNNASWVEFRTDSDGMIEPWLNMPEQVTGGEGLVYPPTVIDLHQWYPTFHNNPYAMWEVMCDMKKFGFDYEMKVLYAQGSDPLSSMVTSDYAVEALKKLFVFEINNQYDQLSQFADVILPDNSAIEKDAMWRLCETQKCCDDRTRGLMGQMVRRPAIEPIYNTRNAEDIKIQILARMDKLSGAQAPDMSKVVDFGAEVIGPMMGGAFGYLPIYNFIYNGDFQDACFPDYPSDALPPELELDPFTEYTYREIVDRKLEALKGCKGFEGFELSYFDKCAFWRYELPLEQGYNYWWAPENQVRMPVYFERQGRIGQELQNSCEALGVTVPGQDMEHLYSHYGALPMWYEEGAAWKPTEEFPLKLINWKIHYGVNYNGQLGENAVLQEVVDTFNPQVKRLWINPVTAEQYGLAEGDVVSIESEFGRFGAQEGKVHLTNLISPQHVGIPGNLGRKSLYMRPQEDWGINFNRMISPEMHTVNPCNTGLEASPRVKISKVK